MKSIFIYNPESGNGKITKNKDYILSRLAQKYGEIEEKPTEYSGHATVLAKQACGTCDYLFVCGGDGTLNEIVNGIGGEENKPIIGYIPTGTVNDVARSLKISKNLKKAVKNLLDGEVFEHDIFKVNDKYGIYVCCTGLFTKSSYDTKRSSKKRFGKIAYFFKGAKEIFTAKPVHVIVKTEQEQINRNCALVLVLNSRSVAGFKLNKKAELNDGMVEVVLIHSHEKKVKLSEIIRCMGTFAFGLDSFKENKKLTYRKLSSFTLVTEEGTTINLDGEKSGAGSFDFTVIKSGVKIIAPKQKQNEQKS